MRDVTVIHPHSNSSLTSSLFSPLLTLSSHTCLSVAQAPQVCSQLRAFTLAVPLCQKCPPTPISFKSFPTYHLLSEIIFPEYPIKTASVLPYLLSLLHFFSIKLNFLICYLPLKYKLLEGRDFCLLYSAVSQCVQQCLAHRHLINFG